LGIKDPVLFLCWEACCICVVVFFVAEMRKDWKNMKNKLKTGKLGNSGGGGSFLEDVIVKALSMGPVLFLVLRRRSVLYLRRLLLRGRNHWGKIKKHKKFPINWKLGNWVMMMVVFFSRGRNCENVHDASMEYGSCSFPSVETKKRVVSASSSPSWKKWEKIEETWTVSDKLKTGKLGNWVMMVVMVVFSKT
jgi:hypothetical protein